MGDDDRAPRLGSDRRTRAAQLRRVSSIDRRGPAARSVGYLAAGDGLDIPATGRSRVRAMRIGELARQAGTTSKAVRFYESAGLLPAPPRASNGYRDYAAADMERLRLLVGLRSLDLPLDRAGELAVLCAAGHCERVSSELRDLITRQRAEIRHRVDDLALLDERLSTLERHLAAGDPPQSVIPRGRSVEMATCDCPCGQCCGCSACGCGCACSSHRRAVGHERRASRDR